MDIDPPALPEAPQWGRFGISDLRELDAGKQSHVFRARVGDFDAAVKLTDRRFGERDPMRTRLAVAESLAGEFPEAVAPLRLDDELVHPIGGWLMTVTHFVSGRPPDAARPGTAASMGRTLARLHAALALVPPQPLPPVAALVAGAVDDRSGRQLLHGDFGAQNLVAAVGGLRVLDFDDCGYGPVEFDIANTLYMASFDAVVHARARHDDRFRPELLAGYAATAGIALGEDVVDHYVDVRVDALARWLDDLGSAPIGIRTSSPEWQATLRSFVRSYARSTRRSRGL